MAKKTKPQRKHLTQAQVLQREYNKSQMAKLMQPDTPEPSVDKQRSTAAPVSDRKSAAASPDKKPDKVSQEESSTGNLAPILLTMADVCKFLNLSRSTVIRMESTGQLPGRINLGGAVRYHRETLEEWFRQIVKKGGSL